MANPFTHKHIQTKLDRRLVECFTKQNKNNDWLTIDDVAGWTYETNDVQGHQRNYVNLKILCIIGSLYSKDANESFLESGYVKRDGHPEFAFRLKTEINPGATASVKDSAYETAA